MTAQLQARLQALEQARRAERDALAWPAWLAAWRAGQDTAGGAAWRDMVELRRAQALETLHDFGDGGP